MTATSRDRAAIGKGEASSDVTVTIGTGATIKAGTNASNAQSVTDVANNMNYQYAYISVPITVSVAVSGVKLNNSSLTLTLGNATATLTATVEPEDATNRTVTWSSNKTSVATVSNGVVTPVGSGTATITATATNGTSATSDDKTATCTVTVNKKANTLAFTSTQSVTKTFSASAQTQTLTAATNAQGAVSYAINSQKQGSANVSYFTLSGTTLAANTPAGTYAVVVRATAAGDTTYDSGTKDSTVTVTLSRANISPAVTISGWTYGEPAQQPAVNSGNPGGGSVTYAYAGRNGTEYSSSSTPPANAGDYTVTATVAQTTNYNGATATANFTVSKANSSAAAPAANTLTYNGAAQALVSGGGATGGTLQYSATQNGTYSATVPTGTNAGSYTVWYKVKGDANHNDTAASGPINVTIAQKVAALSWMEDEFTYDGAA